MREAERRGRVEAAIKLSNKGWSAARIAAKLGVSKRTVYWWFARAGVDRPNQEYFRRDATNEERLARGTGPQDPSTGCTPWLMGTCSGGYGQVTPRGSRPKIRAHRLTLEVHLGRELTTEEVARHTCDNPPCVNPDHLLVGTHMDNARDKISRGRARPPHNSPEKIARRQKAFLLLDKGHTQRAVAKELGVHPTTVNRWVKKNKQAKRRQ